MAKRQICAVAALALFAGAASADTVYGNPTNWRLQNYTGGNTVVWNTGAAGCSSALSFGAGATDADKDKLWSLILTAKMTGHQVGIEYVISGTTCLIQSVFMDS